MAELAKGCEAGVGATVVIESLSKSKSRFLALFAIWTFFVGGALGLMVPMICGTPVRAQGDPDPVGGLRAALQTNASATSLCLAFMSVGLMMLSFIVLAKAYLKESRGSDDGIVRLMARGIYLLSLLVVVGTVSAVVVLIVLQT